MNMKMRGQTSNDQAIKVVLKYLDENPARLNVPASMLVVKALTEAFPYKD